MSKLNAFIIVRFAEDEKEKLIKKAGGKRKLSAYIRQIIQKSLHGK